MKSNKKGVLYLIGVPIGHYDDLTFRALKILQTVDLILCEDTRETKKLLDNFFIKNNLISYISSSNYLVKVLEILNNGGDVGFVSDRGMPCISDPGADIVRYLRELNFHISIIPGVSSITTAFALTGLKGGFFFHGFLPKTKGNMLKIFQKLTKTNHIFLESPYRIYKTLKILEECYPESIIYIVRELTKTYEEILIGTSKELLEKEIKGELVLVLPI